MGIAKVVLNNRTLMDITDDSVKEQVMLNPETAHSKIGEKITGNIPVKQPSDITINGPEVIVPAGFYNEETSQSVNIVEHASPVISLNTDNGEVTATHTQYSGYVYQGTTSNTMSLPTQSGITIPPTESEQVAVEANKYTLGDVKIAAIPSDYVGSNIPKNDASDVVVSGPAINVSSGYYSQPVSTEVTITSHSLPSISINSSTGVITTTHTATEGYVYAGTTSATLSLSTQSVLSIVPSTASQIAVLAGTYVTNNVTIDAMKIESLSVTPTENEQVFTGIENNKGEIIGSFNGDNGSNYVFSILWEVISQNLETNTSTIKFTWRIKKLDTSTPWKVNAPYTLQVDSRTITGTLRVDLRNVAKNTYITVLTRNVDVTTPGGSKILAVHGSLDMSDTRMGVGSYSDNISVVRLDGYRPITVSAIPSDYIGSNVPQISAFAPAVSLDTVSGEITATNTFSNAFVTAGTVSSSISLSTVIGSIIVPTLSVQTVVPKGYYTLGSVSVAALNDFVVTMHEDSETGYFVPDATYEELRSAYDAGVNIVLSTGDENIMAEGSFGPGDGVFNYVVWSDGGDSDLVDYYAFGEYTGLIKTGTVERDIINNQNKLVTPTESQQSVTADSGYTGLSTVTVNAISSTYVGTGIAKVSALTSNLNTVTAPVGYYSSALTVSIASKSAFKPAMSFASNTGTFTATNTFSSAYYPAATAADTINLTTQAATTYTPTVTSQYISSYTWLTGSQTIKGDTNLLSANIRSGVSIFGVSGTYTGTAIDNQDKTFTPDEIGATLVADAGYTGLGTVTVNPISSTYVGTGVSRQTSAGMYQSDAYVYAPSGYYTSEAKYSLPIYDHTAPTILFSSSTGVITANHNAYSVIDGSGITRGAYNTSSSITLPTLGVQTITPGTTNQTINSYQWLVGQQTILGDANLVASNILSGVSIFGVNGTASTYPSGDSIEYGNTPAPN